MKDKTHIIYIIDRSGSMEGLRSDVIGGFNGFIEEQKEHPGEASMVLVQFNHDYGPMKIWNNIQDVIVLNNGSYRPNGTTALLDAIGRTIDDQGKYLSGISEQNRPDKVIVLIMTDGLENASRDYSKMRIKEMIDHQRGKYNWEFIFLGANQDSFIEAHSLGIPMGQTADYSPTGRGVDSVFSTMSCLVGSYRSGGKTNFDEVDRPE